AAPGPAAEGPGGPGPMSPTDPVDPLGASIQRTKTKERAMTAIGTTEDPLPDQREVAPADQPLSIVLFSGTDDRLTAAAVLATGAVVMGRKVELFLQYWAVEAFRAGNLEEDHGLAPEASPQGAEHIAR